MTNLFSRYSVRTALATTAAIVLAGQVAAIFHEANAWIGMATTAGALVVLGYSFVREKRNAAVIRQAIACCHAAGLGDFETRIAARANGDLGELLFATNDLIDRIDAFIREASASMEYAAAINFSGGLSKPECAACSSMHRARSTMRRRLWKTRPRRKK